jgi:hypothetical protein
MSYMPRVDIATTATWPDLVEELDRWGAAGRVASFWWRDDDAVEATRRLDKLLHLAADIPLGLAVIPACACPSLGAALRDRPQIAVLQHGWQHRNHAAAGKKCEYPDGRSAPLAAAEIAAGRARLTAFFGARALPVLVPPWNRFGDSLLPLLAEAEVSVLSGMAAGQKRELPAMVSALDVHVDLTAWHAGRGFVGTSAALARIIGWLRREMPESIGILTHHLVMDAATAAFMEQLLAVIGSHGAARWMSPAEALV